MVRAHEFVENLHFGIVNGQVSVVIVVILAIKAPAQKAGRLETRMASGTIKAVQHEMQQVNIKVGWKDNDRGGKRGQLHNGVLDPRVFPRRRGDDGARIAVVATVKSVERRNVEQIVNAKGPNLAECVARAKLEQGYRQRVLTVGDFVLTVPKASCHKGNKQDGKVSCKALETGPIVIHRDAAVLVDRIGRPTTTQVKVSNDSDTNDMRYRQGRSGMGRLLEGMLEHRSEPLDL